MKYVPFLLLLLLFSACRQDKRQLSQNEPKTEDSPLQLITEDRPDWTFRHLRLYPILADQKFTERNAPARELLTLAEAIDTYGFRISEKKPYGRFEDQSAVNQLTVQNKTTSAVFLIGGDIVRGGRQDRVVGEDQIIAARSLQDIPVFCVEHGRWSFDQNQIEEEAIPDRQKKVFAFSGYYHVASGDIRQTLSGTGSQQEVWDKVRGVTQQYAPESPTGTYAALEGSEQYTRERDRYLDFFTGKFSEMDNTVGLVAVSGRQIVGADLFGHPDLFRRQFDALLHSYVTDAVTIGQAPAVPAEQLQDFLQQITLGMNGKRASRYREALVHYFEPGR